MNDLAKPIVIGVSGHRQLRAKDVDSLKQAVKSQLQAVALKCPNSPIKLLCCLAEGADQLCAEVAEELNIGLIVASPMEISEYKKDFQAGALFNFEKLLSRAEKVIVVSDYEKRPESFTRDYFYRQADIYVALHSHCLIALWDGSPAKAGGCGTAETVDMVLNHTYEHHNKYIRFNDGFVIRIHAPRLDDDTVAGDITYLGNESEFNTNIEKLDELNAGGGNPDELSLQNAKQYQGKLRLLAVLGTALATAFLLYDEIMIRGMLIALMIIFIVMIIAFKIATKSRCHEKYIEYRAFAEALRVQQHSDRIGFDIEVANYLDWSRCFDTAWIHKAMQIMSMYRDVRKSENLLDDWILDQKRYHERAAEKTKKLKQKNKAIILIAAALSIAVYAFAIIFEYGIAYQGMANAEIIRIIIKVSVGLFSAISLFAANYYGKLSLQHVYEDHVRMSSFFAAAEDYVTRFGADDEFLKELVNEELSENSNWCSYEKENSIDLTI
ncbi:MAG: hypothetical protein Q4F55_00140 [Bacillota bacterium]|nr:hypothetical protein [Bacillota bacterium]